MFEADEGRLLAGAQGAQMEAFMTRSVMIGLAAALVASSMVQATQTVKKSDSVTATATIQAIDKANRLVTLKDESGAEDTMQVGPAMKRFDELKVGDKVKVTYSESLVLQVRKPGDAVTTAGDTAKLTKGTGASPSATLSSQQTTSVDVVAIDQKLPSITVKTADGRTVTRKVEDRKNLEGVKVGDKIDITYTQAAIISVEPVK
jgi:Cu/Ag efflux protein CusF